jgi:hypothetical protein
MGNSQSDIELNSILANNEESINRIKTDFQINGYSFIDLSEEFKNNIQIFANKMQDFLQLNDDEKKQHSEYSSLFYKEQLHFLTNKSSNIPHVNKMNNFMNAFMLRLTDILFNPNYEEKQYLTIYDKHSPCGLFDVVQYKNNNQLGKSDNNDFYVTSHADPGLYYLNIYNDENCLKFFNYKTNSWEDAPLNSAILFCGKAAKTLYNYKPALHRVLFLNKNRMSIWYEVGVKSQVTSDDLEKSVTKTTSKVTSDDLEKSVTKTTSQVTWFDLDTSRAVKCKGIKIIVEYDHNKFKHLDTYIEEDATLLDLKKVLEERVGIPMTKVASPSIQQIDSHKKEFKKYYG